MERTKSNTRVPVVLTNDPSMTAWGWAVVSLDGKHSIIDSGCIKTSPDHKKQRIRKSDDRIRRVDEIYQQLGQIIKQHNIRLIISEAPHGSQNASAAVMIGMVAAIIQAFGSLLSYPIEWYSEDDAKKALLNKRSATKQEIIDAIVKEYDFPLTGTKYKDEAMADAMAVYHAARKHSNIIKLYERR